MQRIHSTTGGRGAALVSVSFIVALALSACGRAAAPAATSRTAPVERGTIEVAVSATGDIASAAQASLAFNVTGIVRTVPAQVSEAVRAGEMLAEIDPRSLGAAAAEAQAELIDARLALADLVEPPTALELAQAEQAVLEAAEAVKDAERHLSGVQYPDVEEYQQVLDDALVALDNAQADATLTGLGGETGAVNAAQEVVDRAAEQLGSVQSAEAGCGGCDPDRLRLAQDSYNGAVNSLESAQIQLQMAETAHLQAIRDAQEAVDDAGRSLTAAQAGPRLSDVELAEAELATARADHEQRLADLEDIREGPDPDRAAAAEARLAAAQARVDQVRLVAPFDGIVVAVNVGPGDTVVAGAVAVVVADLSSLHINTRVDELDIGDVELGQPVAITLDALPESLLAGTVARIDLAPDPQQTTTEYPVRVEVEATGDPVRLGMTAVLEILVARKNGVLLVPNWALRFDPDRGGTFVTVQRGDGTAEVPVELGLRNETVSEVLAGLDDGDVVAVLVTPEPSGGGGPFGGGD